MQRGPDGEALVQRHNDALLQVQPVVGADRHSQQPQAADCKHTAQQRQGLPAARAHGDKRGELPAANQRNVQGAIRRGRGEDSGWLQAEI